MILHPERIRIKKNLCKRCLKYYMGSRSSKYCEDCKKPSKKNKVKKVSFSHATCAKCGKMTRRRYADVFCWNCYSKSKRRMPTSTYPTNERIEKALNKIRVAKTYKSSSGSSISLPKWFGGMKFKLILVESKQEK
jgi:hypothetical protein